MPKQSSTVIIDRGTRAGDSDGPSSQHVRSLARGLAIIRCFDVDRPAWNLVDIAEHTGLHIATAHRLAKTLTAAGFLEVDPRSGKYQLGPGLRQTAYLARSDVELTRIAAPHLAQLAAVTGETADLAVSVPQGVLFLDMVLTSRPFKPCGSIGVTETNFTNAHRKVFMAFSSEKERQAQLTAARESMTESEWEALVGKVERTAIEGVGHDIEESNEGIYGMAAPVRDRTGGVRASIGIVAPCERLTPDVVERCVDEVKQTASALSNDLGYRG